MKKTLFLGALFTLILVQCSKKEDDPFSIKKGAIGHLTHTTKMKQLDSIFAADSLVKTNSSPNALETQGEVEVYAKDGKKLLLLSPENETDPNSTITDILVYDSRYKTEEGLNNGSTFKDFKDKYTVSGVQRIINGVLVFFSDSDIYLTIDSRYLTGEVRSNPDANLEAKHIVDSAPIKYLRIGWEPEEGN